MKTDRIGQKFGDYRLTRLLGGGGFGDVYLGIQVQDQTLSAVKVLQARLSNATDIKQFINEARAIRLRHPHIVQLLDFGIAADDIPFLIMDYAPNVTLRDRHPRGTHIPLDTVVIYVKQIASALQYAHDRNLIHRDVKPENMLLGPHHEVLLSDFGLVVVESASSRNTQFGAGTPIYMAPEQFKGKSLAASDQYSLAAVAYEWLCGEPPFTQGNFIQLGYQHNTEPPPPLRNKLSTVSPDIEQVVQIALAKDPMHRFGNVSAFATAFEQASRVVGPVNASSPLNFSSSPSSMGMPQTLSSIPPRVNTPSYRIPPSNPLPQPKLPTPTMHSNPVVTEQSSSAINPSVPRATSPALPQSTTAHPPKGFSKVTAIMLFGLVLIILIGGTGLFSYFSASSRSRSSTGVPTGAATANPNVVRGGTWIDDLYQEPDSLIPNASATTSSAMVDQALYTPLFVGDSKGQIHPALATEVPTVQNGDISSDAKTWTFHLRKGLKWSDGQPLDARDLDFTWRTWVNPKFGAANTIGISLITSTDVSSDNLSITFHLKQPFAPFVSVWVDGLNAPLPQHHFQGMQPDQITKSPDNLNPSITNGPFKLREGKPGDHYTLERDPNYYRASEGLPYLDSIVFRIVPDQNNILKDLQAGSINSAWFLDVSKTPAYQRLTNYKLIGNSASTNFEALYFNLKNPVLGKHQEVRRAIAMAIDHQALIDVARRGQAAPLCTDHGVGLNPGYQKDAPCPKFDVAGANALLDQNGWTKGSDGVRTNNGLRLEFQYSTTANNSWRADDELIIQQNLKAIGIKIDIQNYPASTFFGTFLQDGTPGKYDIAEFENSWTYDGDDASVGATNQIPPNGFNIMFYSNPNLDKLYVAEESTPDPTQRQQIFNQIHQIYLTDFPFVTLYSPTDIAMYKNTVHNYSPGPMGASETINIWEWWCNDGRC